MNTESTEPSGDELTIVIETSDLAEVAIVKSLFENAGLPYMTRGEDQFDAFRGAFRGTVFGSRGRPVVFLVPAGRVADARSLLAHDPGESP